ncbi:CRISPR-associated helicase Cas3' [Caldisericum sp.]|uniref:CRISPR-associated helicase Cas3' n=1 Tax=Caldisericum sp. TaxID=2499687 RepID=UPI003D0BBE3E
MIKADEFYKKYFNVDSPYEHQISSWEQINALKFPLLLKAPTGSGKTEAVLAPFLSQFTDNKFHIAPRLLYVLPMRVLVNSVADRIKRYAQKISPYISVEVQHGDVPNSPFFIADIVVTTLDQFLYGFARASQQVGHHIDIPAGSIASSLVVFDEAHMYRDGFTFSIMRALMEILYKSKIPFVVMTATMPESLEKNLFENISLSNSQRVTGNIKIDSKLKITVENHPLYANGNLSKIGQKKTLIVVNQVKRAQKIYEYIKDALGLEDNNIVLIHSRFTRTDRKEHEIKSISLIPHKEDGEIVIPKGVGIVVSTQVLEAGIDFSAELLLTELAPADSLVQRAGRCARYEGESGEIIVFPVEEENRGHLPYKKEHLEKTLKWLRDNNNFNIKNFNEVCSFVNILDYQANDYEARDTLIDLYECVLYADTKPQNIQVRDSKPATLVVLDIHSGGKGKKEDKIKEVVLGADLKEKSINVGVGTVWDLFENDHIQWEIQWRYNEKDKKHEPLIIDLLKNKKTKDKKDARIGPFRTYIVESNDYKKDKGIYPDVSFII